MTGINAWLEMEHKDHEPGKPCSICKREALQDEDLSPDYAEYEDEF